MVILGLVWGTKVYPDLPYPLNDDMHLKIHVGHPIIIQSMFLNLVAEFISGNIIPKSVKCIHSATELITGQLVRYSLLQDFSFRAFLGIENQERGLLGPLGR